MPSTIDIRRRIRSVKNTQQLTKAMKMVSAAKLRRAQDRIFAARPYAAALREVLSSVAARVDVSKHPMLTDHEAERSVLVVVITADRGLCGAFNANAIRAAVNFINEKKFEKVQVLPIGRKANDYFRRRTIPLRRAALQAIHALSLETAREIADSFVKDFTSGEIDAVYLVYNE